MNLKSIILILSLLNLVSLLFLYLFMKKENGTRKTKKIKEI